MHLSLVFIYIFIHFDSFHLFFQRPMQNQASKTLCCFCCESGPITGVIRIEKSGFVPGEALYIQGEVQNLSDTACSVEVRLFSVSFLHC